MATRAALRDQSVRSADSIAGHPGCLSCSLVVAVRSGCDACALCVARYWKFRAGRCFAVRVRSGNCSAAWWRPHRSMVWIAIGVVGVLSSVFNVESYLGSTAGAAVLGISAAALVVGLDYTAPSWLHRVLSLRAVVTVGVLSYGIYLWHGPLMRFAADSGYSGQNWRAGVAVFAVLEAGVSHRYVEAPIRSWARRQGKAEARRPTDRPSRTGNRDALKTAHE